MSMYFDKSVAGHLCRVQSSDCSVAGQLHFYQNNKSVAGQLQSVLYSSKQTCRHDCLRRQIFPWQHNYQAHLDLNCVGWKNICVKSGPYGSLSAATSCCYGLLVSTSSIYGINYIDGDQLQTLDKLLRVSLSSTTILGIDHS